MPRISREDYYEFHESREELMRDNNIRPRGCLRPGRQFANCEACGVTLDIDDLDERGLCYECSPEVKRLEEGKVMSEIVKAHRVYSLVEWAKIYLRRAQESLAEAEETTRKLQEKVSQASITAGERWEEMSVARDEMTAIVQAILRIDFEALDHCQLKCFEGWSASRNRP